MPSNPIIDSLVLSPSTSNSVLDTTSRSLDSLMTFIQEPTSEVITEMQRLGGSVADVVQNTSPYNFGWGDIVWWNFGIGMAALVAGILAALFGFLGFRYQKRAAVSLEGREGKAFQFDMIIRMVYSNISFLIAFNQKCTKEKREVPFNRVEAMKIPLELIDPSVFSNDPRVYGLVVQLKRDFVIYNQDLESFKVYCGEGSAIANSYVSTLICQMMMLINNLGIIMATIDYKETYKKYVKDENEKYWNEFLFESGLKNEDYEKDDPLEDVEGRFNRIIMRIELFFLYFLYLYYIPKYWLIYLKKRRAKKTLVIKPKYYSPYIANAVLNSHFDDIGYIDKEWVRDILKNDLDLPDVVDERLQYMKWDADVFSEQCNFRYQDLMEGYNIREVAEHPEIAKRYPHFTYFRNQEKMALNDFILSALRFESALKLADTSLFY